MNIITLDSETFYSDEFTLSKLTTEAYVRDARFEPLCWAVKFPNQKTVWWDAPTSVEQFKKIDWSDTVIVCHHAQFDAFILSHHYGIKPKFIFDTLSMGRHNLGNHLSVSLENLAKHFGLAAKTVPYNLFKGRHWHELSPEVQRMVGEGACHDVELTWQLFQILGKDFPREEYEYVDHTIKMFTDPVLRADVDLLATIWEREERGKAGRLQSLNVAATDLASNDKFAELLRAEGVEPERKTSPKGKQIYAFAKTDDFMRDLAEHESDRVRALAEARLGEKSTLMQTRAETLGWMASRGPLPVYLRCYGAGTLRPSGGDKVNWLNFKRGSDLRKSILAPEGYLLGPVDASQIECRALNYLAGQEDVIEKFRNGIDPYVGIASQFYGEAIYKPKRDDPRREEMEQKRGAGKQAELMCGYGASGKQFVATAKAGLYGPPITMELEEGNRMVKIYRDTHPAICAKNTGYWAQGERMLARLAGGPPMDWGPLHVKDHRIYLPNGTCMIYDTMEYHHPDADEDVRDFERSGYWRVKTRYGWKKMWGSKLAQNICEAVSRVIVTQAMIRLARMGYRALNHPYDELLMLIPKDGREEQHLQICLDEMQRPVDWLPGLPIEAEGSLGERYSK